MLAFIFDLLRWLTACAMAASILSGLGLAGLLLIRRTQPNKWANWLFAALLVAMSLTLLDKFLNFTYLTKRHPSVSVLPIYLSFAFGPLLFYYVKSRLYRRFDMTRSDFKHFILPTVQFALLIMMTFRDADSKAAFRTDFFSPFYGNFEKGVFIMQFFLYLYFSYRFILHERSALMQKRKSHLSGRRHVLVVGWLKRMVKVLFILFGIHAYFILSDYFSYRLFDLNLQTKTLFSMVYELSFTAMLGWVCLNAFFALQRKL
jgi:hypothetical protein